MSISHCRTRRNLVALAATATVATLAGLSSPGLMAQGAFPSKAITMVVPYPPGGSNDVFARQVAKEMGDVLKQTVIVDNRPGASGNTGTAFVAKSTADGYTLVAVSSSMTTNAAVQTKMPFDPVRSLAPVAMFAKGPLVVAVNNEFPAKTPEELVRTIKARPGQFNYATSGTGSINHFATEMMRSMVPGMDIMHVPYKGQGPAVTDVIGILPMVRNGKLRAIGITSLKPSPIAPDLTPMSTAIPGYEFDLWWGLLAPAGTPADIVERLNQAVNQVLAKPAIQASFLREGAIAHPVTPQQFGEVIRTDVARWKQLAKERNIQAD
jgi:tripartite-type tricarboxylate transporter receptor subunit TctC